MQMAFQRKCFLLPLKYKSDPVACLSPGKTWVFIFKKLFKNFSPICPLIAMKKLLAFPIFILPLMFLSLPEEDFIKWQESRRLTWEDFKAEPMKLGNTAAMTTTHLGFAYNVSNGKVTYRIDCRFEKNKSWGLVKNDWILRHEQGHFDIAEIFARRLNRLTSEYQFNRTSFQKDIDGIYRSVVDEKEKFQQHYDDETDYSRNKTNQEEWFKKIEAELKQSKNWAGY